MMRYFCGQDSSGKKSYLVYNEKELKIPAEFAAKFLLTNPVEISEEEYYKQNNAE